MKTSFKLIGNLVIICFRWSKWARSHYNQTFHRYMSFTQFYESNDKGESKLRNLESENAKIRAEMMNFNANFIRSITSNENKITIGSEA